VTSLEVGMALTALVQCNITVNFTRAW